VPIAHTKPDDDSEGLPNSTFVGLIVGRDFVRVETEGQVWLDIQDTIRPILNQHWDPIGVADISEDEYDSYTVTSTVF